MNAALSPPGPDPCLCLAPTNEFVPPSLYAARFPRRTVTRFGRCQARPHAIITG